MGVGAITVTVAEALAVPPGPVQESVNVVVVVSAPVDCEPLVALLPVQLPLLGLADPVQVLALVVFQLSVADPPDDTDVGEAERETVGGGGVGVGVGPITIVCESVLLDSLDSAKRFTSSAYAMIVCVPLGMK